MLSISFYKVSIILIAHADKETTTTNYRPITLINIGAKVPYIILASGIKQ